MYLAQEPWSNPSGEQPAQISDLEAVFSRVFMYIIGLAGITLFVLLCLGGLKLITSSGDPGKVQAAWKTITFAIAGLVFIIASFLIMRLIKEFTGVNVLEFTIPTQ